MIYGAYPLEGHRCLFLKSCGSAPWKTEHTTLSFRCQGISQIWGRLCLSLFISASVGAFGIPPQPCFPPPAQRVRPGGPQGWIRECPKCQGRGPEQSQGQPKGPLRAPALSEGCILAPVFIYFSDYESSACSVLKTWKMQISENYYIFKSTAFSGLRSQIKAPAWSGSKICFPPSWIKERALD